MVVSDVADDDLDYGDDDGDDDDDLMTITVLTKKIAITMTIVLTVPRMPFFPVALLSKSLAVLSHPVTIYNLPTDHPPPLPPAH